MFKSKLLLGTVLAAGTLMLTAPAQAFDYVEWSWDAEVNTDVDLDLDIVDPSEFAMIESLQIKLGDTTATSNVNNIYNNQPMSGTASGTFSFEGEAWDNDVLGGIEPPVDAFTGQTSGNVDGIAAGQGTNPATFTTDGADVAGSPDIEGGISDATGAFTNANITVNGAVTNPFGADGIGAGNGVADEPDGVIFTVTVDGLEVEGASYDAATELPSLDATATALANNASIEGQGVVNVHAGQFAFDPAGTGGEIDEPNGGESELASFNYDPTNPNSNLSGALALAALALNGDVGPSAITATSNAHHIDNFAVDAGATALANNMNISVVAGGTPDVEEPDTGEMSSAFCFMGCGNGNDDDNDGIQPDVALIADVTQFAYADVSATSNVHHINLNNYTGLGSLDQPVINGTATAIGNNLSIKVGAPAIDVE